MTLGSALPAPAEQAPDKDGPGVARVSVIEGSAVVQRGDSHTQTAAVRNAPLLPGDYVSTGSTSRAELQFDGMTAVRLGGSVQARITNNDPTNRAMQLADGTVEIGIVRDGRAFQIDTPSVSVRAQRAGDYRITIARDGSSWITARRGSVEVITPQQTYTLQSGRTLVARGGASHASITYTSEVAFDSFDDFNAKRDSTMLAALNSSPNLNPQIAGYDNLDAYGQWQNVAGYGQVWVPYQSSNWAPYRNGSWVWEGGYGWTWVGNEPWGWAPYHYGNWFYANGYGWAWYPPQAYAYPAWQPALVGFFGFSIGGPGFGVSVGFSDPCYGYGYPYGYGHGYPYYGCSFGYPYVGWIPIAPFEPFYPYYPGWAWTGFGWGFPGYGYGGYNNVSITRIVNVYNINKYYRNWRYGGGSGTLIGQFHHGSIIGHTIAVDPHRITHIGTLKGGLPIAPSRENLGFGRGLLRAPVSFAKAFNSPRFAAARGIVRTPFEQQQRVIARSIAAHASVLRAQSVNATRQRGAVPVNRQLAPVTRENAAAMRQNAPAMRENAPAMRQNAPAMRENALPTSWQRFNQARGTELRGIQERSAAPERPATLDRPTTTQRAQAAVTRQERAPADSWGRFSQQRSSVSVPSYARRDSVPSYSRESAPSYSRAAAPSYSRGSYPSYSRGSYPSYSREAYPSYARPSYSRPSYQSGPSYSHAPPSGGSRPPAGNSGGGGGGRHDSGRRPPA
ncbi:MAG: FecR domain-containing protein [Candidatus Eremiobacteraeota bacterium]|nr:FecR domain-containing protein [Candidatus Eremiobacteraeota bacterium]